ncbi:MAG: hypothetical protein SGJ00_12665 [bacterium]|nr:hypothetical protein [bacterium]
MAIYLFVSIPNVKAQMPSITGFAPAAAHPRAILTIYYRLCSCGGIPTCYFNYLLQALLLRRHTHVLF